MRLILQSKDLDDFILKDPTSTKPTEKNTYGPWDGRKAAEWKAKDSEVQLFLLAHMSRNAKDQFLSRTLFDDAFRMWEMLHEIFGYFF